MADRENVFKKGGISMNSVSDTGKNDELAGFMNVKTTLLKQQIGNMAKIN